jgi:hypothetical protein
MIRVMQQSATDTMLRTIVMCAVLGGLGWLLVCHTTIPRLLMQRAISWYENRPDQSLDSGQVAVSGRSAPGAPRCFHEPFGGAQAIGQGGLYAADGGTAGAQAGHYPVQVTSGYEIEDGRPASAWPNHVGQVTLPQTGNAHGGRPAASLPPAGAGQGGAAQGSAGPAGALETVVGDGIVAQSVTGALVPDRRRQIETRLQALGAVYMLLETWGRNQVVYRFHCQVAFAGGANETRSFEENGDNAVEAMQRVLDDVESWRAQVSHFNPAGP